MGGSLRGSTDIRGACGNGGTKCGKAARSGPAGSPAFSCRNDLTPYRMRCRRATNEAVQMRVVEEWPASSVQDSEESDLGTYVDGDRRRSPKVRTAVRKSTRAVRSEIPI